MEIDKKNEDLDKLLFETIGIFEKYNFEWWFECGTLLGMLRESNYLEWENDIDLGCWNSSLNLLNNPNFIKDFNNAGIRMVLQDCTATFWKGEDVYLDINFYRVDEDFLIMDRWLPNSFFGKLAKLFHRVASSPTYYDYSWSFKKKSMVINLSKFICYFVPTISIIKILDIILPKCQDYSPWRVPKIFFEGEFKEKLFRNMTVFIPPDSEGYLSYRYGNNWRVPNRKWDTETQDATIV